MRLLDMLERKIGWFAVRNLILYVIIGNAAVFLFGFTGIGGAEFAARLMLLPGEVLRGEVWRVVTFVFAESFGSSPIFLLLELYFLYMIGTSLEHAWGSFKMNFYYFCGLAATVAASLLTGAPGSAGAIHLSLFLAFAQLAPELQILIFFFIPVKIKWLGWAAWAFTAYSFVMAGSWQARLLIAMPLCAFFLFFGGGIVRGLRNNRRAFFNRRDFELKKADAERAKGTFHRCAVCGRTEKDAPELEFRYCSRCEGDYEYCAEHLHAHTHKV
ncbi:MAG: rhomboid family intramembrane serine protease [Clostridiales bacterium]|nr:rhomboid family intramembrane serine protease [Clostridiales bacterium]